MAEKFSKGVNRATEFEAFSNIVIGHIVNYTVPQYGDAPDDEVAKWSAQECINAISKYVKRFDNNARGDERYRDMAKIAHFACLAFWKLMADAGLSKERAILKAIYGGKPIEKQ